MRHIRFTAFCYIAALILLVVHGYCQTRAAQYFDFKSGLGAHMALAEVWLARSQYAFWTGLACTIAGSACAPFRRKWENLALAVCAAAAYGLIAIFFNIQAA